MKSTITSFSRSISLICCFFAMLAVGSCQKPPVTGREPSPGPGDPTDVVLSVSTIDMKTRLDVQDNIIHTKWSEGDEIGVFMKFNDVESTGHYRLQSGSIDEKGTTAQFAGLEAGVMKWQAAALPHTFYAYAPKTSGDSDPKSIPVTLPAEQKQDGVGHEDISKYNFMIAEPVQIISPRTFTDKQQAKNVGLRLRGAFSIIEFRFAAYKGATSDPDVRIQKVTLESKNNPLAVTKGTVDITEPEYATHFANVSVKESEDLLKKVSLEISNAPALPFTTRQQVIPDSKSREEANGEVEFPARMVVLPNMSRGLEWENDEWSVSIEYTVNGVSRTTCERNISPRALKTGERHAISFVLNIENPDGNSHVSEGDVERDFFPNGEDKGPQWDGTFSDTDKPQMTPVMRQKRDNRENLVWKKVEKKDEDGNVIKDEKGNPVYVTEPVMETVCHIEIRTPAELAWFANAINTQTPKIGTGTENAPEEMLYDGGVLKIMNNIDLNGHPWKPIGFDGTRYFRGNVDGDGDGDGKSNLISGLNVCPTTLGEITSAGSLMYLHFGLFGIVQTRADLCPLYFKDLRVQGAVVMSNAVASAITTTIKRTGGVAGSLGYTNISNCMFSGQVEATYLKTASDVGGIASYASYVKCRECRSFANVKLNSSESKDGNAGGLIGSMANSGKITGSDFGGTITVYGPASVGGVLARSMTGVLVTACRNNGSIDVKAGNDNKVGGIVGYMVGGKVWACYNKGRLECADGRSNSDNGAIGGIVGLIITAPSSEVKACYNRGEVFPSKNQKNCSGNIVGFYSFSSLVNFDYNHISDNYYVTNEMVADVLPKLELNSVIRFSPTNWPKPEGLWRLGDGSGDEGPYWHVASQTSYGTENWSYPQLYWETIR